MRHFNTTRLYSLLPLLAAALSMGGCKSSSTVTDTTSPIAPAAAARVETASDQSWISLTGTVVHASPHDFVLDYGDGEITVEMDDWDWFPEGEHLLENDRVVVYGYIDDDFYERRTIEASSVFVRDLGTQFFASGVDDEEFRAMTYVDASPQIDVSGVVHEIKGSEFELATAAGMIDVETRHMGYDPLDDEGFQRIEPGDRVRVSGELGYELFADRDLMADYVVSLN